MTMITPSYLGETIEYSSLHACRSTLEDPTCRLLGVVLNAVDSSAPDYYYSYRYYPYAYGYGYGEEGGKHSQFPSGLDDKIKS